MRFFAELCAAVIALIFSGCSSSSTTTITPAPPTTIPSSNDSASKTATTTSPLSKGEVAISNGPISGINIAKNTTKQQPIVQDVEVFYGIPFAKSPVGDLRFRAPQQFDEHWTTVKKMDTKQSQCPDKYGRGDEDCLYLNVWRPANATLGSKLPVMAWIFGGGFVDGNAASSDYDGSALASQHNVVVVTMNYRLGDLGYFASPASFNEEGTTGNWGQLDQQLALKWIQKNIEAFGGDKDRVLLFGESAGAFSVVWHIAAPSSAGLFHSAVLESSTSHTDIFFQQPQDAYRYYDWVAKELVGCKDANDMDCLRHVDASKFTLPKNVRFDPNQCPEWGSPIFPMMPVGPCIDGKILPDVPLNMVKKGDFNKVPTIVGTNRDEGTAFVAGLSGVVPGVPRQPDMDDVRTLLFYMLQSEEAVDEALAAYPVADYTTTYGTESQGFELASEMIRDAIFHCPSQELAQAISDNGGDAYMYLFNMDPIFPKWVDKINTGNRPMFGFGNFTPEQMGTFHSSEIPFVFKRFEDHGVTVKEPNMYEVYMGHPPRQPGDVYHQVSDKMSCMWASMAASGKPVGGDVVCPPQPHLPNWGTYMANSKNSLGQYLHLGRDVQMEPLVKDNAYPHSEFASKDVCEFWNAQQFRFHDLRSDLTNTTTADEKRVIMV
ncbi:Acetylcholinesterase 1 precursor, putative [Perkinsus marinus ATCC 50983]|uniref:Carboxylic ester hydrolase n=1 Tax=Perkinsus marinus (strain ATCC 50983 / TXsc) TaxID=423536 RepID=C5L6E8_PERM5|nr:Acetylcholinesterase 1 precursor, putative [Perkinsus marinus ATCC 50983]EER07696.1 Acetylcholinesterase 1 precursor, putative [Perkinsus marinus ATCC 50983]|eukprot:XP_002775880.1 Acetylcholinesterase 1 precursor, putative [Perkinsus marinus ATCC 50983]